MNLEQIAMLNAGAVAVEVNFRNTPLISYKQFDRIFNQIDDSITWHCIGQTAMVFYCKCEGKTVVSRKQGAAVTVMTNNGQKVEIFMQDGVLHNPDGPAVIVPGISDDSKVQLWYLNGMLRKKKVDMPYLFKDTWSTEEIDYFDNGKAASIKATYMSDGHREIQVNQYGRFGICYMNYFSATGKQTRENWWFCGVNVTTIVKLFKKAFKRGS